MKKRDTGTELLRIIAIMFSAIAMKMYLGNSDSGLVQKLLRIFARSDLYSIMPFLISMFLFFVFKEIKIKYNKVMLLVAKSTFGIYLIHDNQMFFNLYGKNNKCGVFK